MPNVGRCPPKAISVPGTETSGSIADLVVNAVKDMDCLPNVHGATVAALLRLWDGDWKMDPGMMTVGKNSKLGDGNEQLILALYLHVALFSFSYLCLSRARPAHPALLDLPDERSAASVPRRSAWSVHTSTTRTFAPLLKMLTDDAGTGGEGEAHKVP
ncbi:hypothetical protein B0H14DRAFT_3555436 [Mycena olivaceomarginata]|nr:hypothetical protein B0H14DRAFT_3555436 [Mycena olivaceomarginata]